MYRGGWTYDTIGHTSRTGNYPSNRSGPNFDSLNGNS